MQRPHVVIVGAGFGGLACAKALRHVAVDVTIVERTNYHLFQPLLYQVASGLLDPSEIAHPVRSIMRRSRNVHVVMAEATGVDLAGRRLMTRNGSMSYDTLVLAAGSVTDYFGKEGVSAKTEGLKFLDEALALRSHLLRNFELAAKCSDKTSRQRLLTFAVVGGGPTGVEYAGAVAELINHVLPRDYPEIDFSRVHVMLLEAGERLLPTFSPGLSRAALRHLRSKHIDVRLNTALRDIDADEMVLQDGQRIRSAMVVWTAGVHAQPLGSTMGVATQRHGRLRVTKSLHLPEHPEVFVIGDMAEIGSPAGPLPMLAPVAIQGGQHVARVIEHRLAGVPDDVFRYRDKGTMATIGRGQAVAQIGPVHIDGLIGWLMWLFVHFIYLIGFRSRVIALMSWAWNYFFYDRPVRLITMPPDAE
jgi:NADH dehydrogenase